MKRGSGNRRFLPPQKSMFDRVSEAVFDAVDDTLSKILGRKKSPRRMMKEIKDGMVLYQNKKR